MLGITRELRDAYYANFNSIATVILLIYQFLHFRQKRGIPSFCVGRIQQFFQRIHQNFFGSLPEEIPWYKKVFNNVLNFLSKDYLWLILEIVIMAALIQNNGVFNSSFGKLVGTGANYFALLFVNGAIYILYCCIVGINPLKQLDWATPSYPLALIFVKFACFAAGCCYGIEWEHGLYSYRNEKYEFPVQLIELFWALAIFIFMMLYKKKAKTGTLFPIYLILYSSTRFFSEFLRREDNVLGILKVYHILCIIGVVVGVIGLIIVNKYGSIINAHFEKNYRGVIGTITRKIKMVEDDDTPSELTKEKYEAVKAKKEKAKKRKEVRKRKGRIKF